MSKQELNSLDDSALFNYFCEETKYHTKNPNGYQYSIRVGNGGLSIFSGDTEELRKKFFKAVRG
jgi:hypothetical protein